MGIVFPYSLLTSTGSVLTRLQVKVPKTNSHPAVALRMSPPSQPAISGKSNFGLGSVYIYIYICTTPYII